MCVCVGGWGWRVSLAWTIATRLANPDADDDNDWFEILQPCVAGSVRTVLMRMTVKVMIWFGMNTYSQVGLDIADNGEGGFGIE